MIRPFKTEDLDDVMRIWLDTNVKTHEYIAEKYWMDNFAMVRKMIPNSEVYVFDDGSEIQAFVGIVNGYIAGIFVTESMQSKGIGKQLLEMCKEHYSKLTLNVYEKNQRAISFYMREGFSVKGKQVDKKTGEAEMLLCWNR